MKTKGIYFLYRILQAFGLPVLILYFLFRGIRNHGYWRSLPERFGFLPRSLRQTSPGAIWLHAVSVGEVLSCVEFLRGIRAEFPRTAVFVSTATLAGHATAVEKLKGLTEGVLYAPVDYVFVIRRVLRTLRPSILVTAETEIWPNLFRETKRTGAAVLLVNGRISDKALPKYVRWRRFFAPALATPDAILVQTDEMQRRFVSLGAPPDRTSVAGNFKYDFGARALPADSPVKSLLDRLRPAQIWIAASTTAPAGPDDPDEDDVVIAAFRELVQRHPGLMLILAPRKPERFDLAAGKLEAAGLSYIRRSRLEAAPASPPQVLLLDSIGELGALFSVADVVFMGGTLVQRGGHNILEPALFGKPVIAGPHMENFQAIADDFAATSAYVTVTAPAELSAEVDRLLSAPQEARALGQRGLACAEAKRGASARAVQEVRRLRRVPAYRPPMPWYPVAWLLARAWELGSFRKQRRNAEHRRRLPVPVISVGNLTMGGTGKTPCVLRLASYFKERSQNPGILTRGYGRQSPDAILIAAPGATVSPLDTGDEAQIFIRSGVAPVGIGARRFQSGTRLLQEFGCSVLLLDDGFQHTQLERDLDIVLIDGLEPFGKGDVFPLGRLREPVAGLARAGIILITRCDGSDLAEPITRELRRWNEKAPVFEASVEPLAWVEYSTGKRFAPTELPVGETGAFCGLGNPAAFRLTLEKLGVKVADWVEFGDHHRYRPRELQNVAQQTIACGAKALVTTEKDSINLCDDAGALVAPLSLYWLQIGIKIDREEEFLAAVGRHNQR